MGFEQDPYYTDEVQIIELERPYTVLCDCCGDEGTGTESQLRRNGWLLTPNEAICGRHD